MHNNAVRADRWLAFARRGRSLRAFGQLVFVISPAPSFRVNGFQDMRGDLNWYEQHRPREGMSLAS